MHDILDLCLECKGCKAECPTAVDMARYKAEYLNAYQREHGVPVRSRLFGELARLYRLGRPVAPIVNAVQESPIVRRALDGLLGIDRRRRLPRLARRGPRIPTVGVEAVDPGARPVVLFVDTFAEFTQPESAEAARRVLEAAGYTVIRALRQGCCGRPMISKGLLQRAREYALRNIEALFPYVEKGIPIIGLEPSCLLTLRDEYREFFPSDARSQVVAEASLLLEEFLTRPDAQGRKPIQRLGFVRDQVRVAVHGHCHAKSLVGMAPLVQALSESGAEVTEIDSGCCGMAGSFGYEAEHYDLSQQIGDMRLFPAVRQAVERGGVVVATGSSCRAQIADGTGAAALDLPQFLASRLDLR